MTKKAKHPPECSWSRADDDTDMWETSCGHAFQFFDDGPRENLFSFCPYCGRRMDAAPVRLSTAMRPVLAQEGGDRG